MPTIGRFLSIVAILAGIAVAVVVALAYGVRPVEREIVVDIPPERLNR
jgi:hypothetical protein